MKWRTEKIQDILVGSMSMSGRKVNVPDDRSYEHAAPPEHVQLSAELLENIAQEFSDIHNDNCSPYDIYISSFNSDQLRIFINIISSLHAQLPDISVPGNVSNLLVEADNKPIFTFVSGYGGTGKSYLIKGLTAYVKQVFQSRVALMAPTGIAASNINGMTAHRLLQLPIQHGTVPPYYTLADHSLHLKHFVLDTVR